MFCKDCCEVCGCCDKYLSQQPHTSQQSLQNILHFITFMIFFIFWNEECHKCYKIQKTFFNNSQNYTSSYSEHFLNV